MQVLTASQVRQLRLTAAATYDALQIVEDFACHQVIDPALVALTSPQALTAYRLTGKAIYHAVMLTAAAAFYSGVLARHGWNAFVQWANGYVASCQVVSGGIQPDTTEPVANITAPVPLLPPARERRCNQVQAVVNPTLITPSPTQPSKRRGRPKGSKSRAKVA